MFAQKAPKAAVTGLALLTLLAGCTGGKPAADTGSNSAASAKQIELTVQTWPGISTDVLANVDAEFTAKHPNVKLNLKEGAMKPNPTPDASLLEGVDVVFLSDAQVSTYATGNLLKDLSAVKLPQPGDAVANLFDEIGRVNGKRYAVPVAISPTQIIVNSQALAQAGVKMPTANWTWQEFEQDLAATKAIGAQNAVTITGILDPILRAYGGQVYDADKQQYVLDSAGAKQGLAALQPFVKDQLAQAQLGGAITMVQSAAGANGNNASKPVGTAFIAAGGSIFLKGGQTTMLPYPKGPKGQPAPASATVAAVSAASPNAEMASEYVRELLNNVGEQTVLARGGIRPVTNNAGALTAWQQVVGDSTARWTEAALADAYVATPIPNQNQVIQGLLPYLNGTAALDATVSGLMSTLNK